MHTNSARLVEADTSVRRPSYGALEVPITIGDPEPYTHPCPWAVEMNQEITLDTDRIDEMLENEKSSQRLNLQKDRLAPRRNPCGLAIGFHR